MSKFSETAAASRAAHADHFGDTITVTSPGGSPAETTAVVGKSKVVTRMDSNGRRERLTVRNVRFTELTTIRHDATLTIDGESWAIDEIHSRTASGLMVQAVRTHAYQVSRPGYRGKG